MPDLASKVGSVITKEDIQRYHLRDAGWRFGYDLQMYKRDGTMVALEPLEDGAFRVEFYFPIYNGSERRTEPPS